MVAISGHQYVALWQRASLLIRAARVLQNSSDMPQAESLRKARGATRPGVSLSVALLQIL